MYPCPPPNRAVEPNAHGWLRRAFVLRFLGRGHRLTSTLGAFACYKKVLDAPLCSYYSLFHGEALGSTGNQEKTMSQSINQIVATALEGASEAYLQDIAAHGIHNVTNNYNGNTDDDYEAFANEFERQANAALAAIEAARLAEFRAA
jgi:hypothetical protein